MNADGSGEARVLATTSDLFKSATDWTREGLVITNIGSTTFRDIWLAPDPRGGQARPLIQTRFSEGLAKVSPDGHWIAYISNEAGGDDVYIQSFPTPGHKTRVSSGGANIMWWMPGCDEICYRSASRTLMMSAKLTRQGEDLEVGEPRILFRYPTESTSSEFSHDGKRVLVSYTGADAQSRTARVILNWTTLVKR